MRCQRGGGHDDDNDAKSSAGAGSRGRRCKCHNCRICGHFARDCWKPKKEKVQKEKALLCDAGNHPGLF